MNGLENANGSNKAPGGTEAQAEDALSLADHCRQISHDAHALAAAVHEGSAELEHYLTEQVEERPYVTLGIAAGVGYVLGGGLRSRWTAALLGAAGRVAIAVAVRELAARLSPGAPAPVRNL